MTADTRAGRAVGDPSGNAGHAPGAAGDGGAGDGAGRKIEFYHPDRTLPVSVTGQACGLNCAHCGGHYLEGMVPASEALDRVVDGVPGGAGAGPRYSSCLISGGCDSAGKVPVLREVELLRSLKRLGLRLNFHTGLVSRDEAAEIGRLADHVSFDLVGDDETVREVFGVSATAADYFAAYEALSAHARVTPHVCIGLRGGRISGELRVLDYLAGRWRGSGGSEPGQVVFIVFTPTRGSLYENRTPPAPEDVASVVRRARRVMPGVNLKLGCMRPGGRYRPVVDVLCMDAGVDGVVNPAREAEEHARRLGLDVVARRECCVL
ncbi:MAG: radical SAM protein [Firmicutes bacterium]|nr:radical SAM protein [Bacillota bacterium]